MSGYIKAAWVVCKHIAKEAFRKKYWISGQSQDGSLECWAKAVEIDIEIQGISAMNRR